MSDFVGGVMDSLQGEVPELDSLDIAWARLLGIPLKRACELKTEVLGTRAVSDAMNHYTMEDDPL